MSFYKNIYLFNYFVCVMFMFYICFMYIYYCINYNNNSINKLFYKKLVSYF